MNIVQYIYFEEKCQVFGAWNKIFSIYKIQIPRTNGKDRGGCVA